MLIKAPRGTRDLFGDEITIWQEVEETIRELCKDFCIKEMRTPIFEHTELFLRGVGETTDIVQKEMYTFSDRKDRKITLRPEGTAGFARAFIENKLYANTLPEKLFYIGPMFRYERPQAGRMRQFHQFGVESFGAEGAQADAELISFIYELFRRLSIKNVTLNMNSLGCPHCRKLYNEGLTDFIGSMVSELCGDCQERYIKNPLRVLDCKNDSCQHRLQNAPLMLDMLDDECKNHFAHLQEILTAMDIPFVVDGKIVRGLDYYTKTVFEFISEDLGAKSTVCGGGRYDKLIEEFGGPKTPAVGFAIGLERLVLAIKNQKGQGEKQNNCDIFIGTAGESGVLAAQSLVFRLRQHHIKAETDNLSRSVKAQLKYADKIFARFSAVIGERELIENTINIKNMITGQITTCPLAAEKVLHFLQKEQ